MTIGLVILGIAAVLIFFGAAEKYFESMGVTSWLSFIIILSLVLGAVLPDIEINKVTISIGGYIVPILVTFILISAIRQGSVLTKALPSIILVFIISSGVEIALKTFTEEVFVGYSILVGLACGAVSFVFNDNQMNVLLSVMAGMIMGETTSSIASIFIGQTETFSLGTYGFYDSLIIASAFGLTMFQLITAIRKSHINRVARSNLNAEMAEDMQINNYSGQEKTSRLSASKLKNLKRWSKNRKNAENELNYLDD